MDGEGFHVYVTKRYSEFVSSINHVLICVNKAYLPLTSNSRVICRFTHDKTQQEQGGAWKSQRNEIIIPTGAPPLGRTLLSWLAIKIPRIP